MDGCELNPERAHLVNAEAVEILARASRQVGASFVTVSTDYVFDGDKEGFYTQRDDPEPRSVYGVAKLQGERRAQGATARCVVARTGWVFGAGGKNFLARVIELARAGAPLKAIADAFGTPTYAPHLAQRLRERPAELARVYHVRTGRGTSPGFALEDVRLAGWRRARRGRLAGIAASPARARATRHALLLYEAVGLAPMPMARRAREFARHPAAAPRAGGAQKK